MAEISAIIRAAYERLCELQPSEAGFDVILFSSIRFIGIDIDRKTIINSVDLREKLLEPFLDHGKMKIVQVTGDSGTPISYDKLPYARNILDEFVTNDTLIEYGFTRSEHDANWLVEDLTTRKPGLKSLLIGNIVQGTMDSINPPTWSALSDIEHLVFLYRRHGDPTTFGDDIWVSDGVMIAEAGDTMICLEGGLQAFSQCVNVLLANVRVIAVTGLREGDATKRFSAAGLLASMVQEGFSEENASTYLSRNPPKSEKQYENIKEDIRRLLGLGSGEQARNFPIEIHLA